MSTDLQRRHFLLVAARTAGGLITGASLPAAAWAQHSMQLELLGDDAIVLSSFVRIARDNRVIIGARGCETGQGVITSLPMIIAEELDVDWQHVQVVQLPWGQPGPGGRLGAHYGSQHSLGSTSIVEGWHELRRVGAAARALLLRAAAREWRLKIAQLRTEAGHVLSDDGRRLSYGALVKRAVDMSLPPGEIALKSPDQYRLLGRPIPVADGRRLVTGAARFGIDHYFADAFAAVVARCPFRGGGLASFNDKSSREVPGVVSVVTLDAGHARGMPSAAGVAVLAEDTWAALQGRRALDIVWKHPPNPLQSTADLAREAHRLLDASGNDTASDNAHVAPVMIRNDGDYSATRKKAARVIDARYQLPFLAHATLEPPAALVDIRSDGALLVASLQRPAAAAQLVADLTGLPLRSIEVRMTRAGGAFGRRLDNDYVAEAVQLGRAAGRPLRLLWTRDDDLTHDFYRPFSVHAMSATLDAQQRITGWSHRIAATPFNDALNGDAPWAGNVTADGFPAGLMNDVQMDFRPLPVPLPLGHHRGEPQTSLAFAQQCFIDEIALATRSDAVEMRIGLLGEPRQVVYGDRGGPVFDTGRMARVLTDCAEKIGWGIHRTDGHGIGIACHFTFGAYVAVAFEVSVSVRTGDMTIHRAVAVADVGTVINSSIVRGQLEGAINDGIATTLHLGVHLHDGEIYPRTLRNYPLARAAQAPLRIDTILVDSSETPVGASEMGLPPVAPALANAIARATTVRVRRLPLLGELMRRL